ncbi:MAG: ATP-binding protein [Planctomycetota bacterium]|nr:ATP-binding protein [Planctomycetota bacterium]
MSIRSILLVILVISMAASVAFTFKMMEHSNTIVKMNLDFKTQKNDVDLLHEMLERDLTFLYLMTDLTRQLDLSQEIGNNRAATLLKPIELIRKRLLTEIPNKMVSRLDTWEQELGPYAQEIGEQSSVLALKDARSSLTNLQVEIEHWFEAADLYINDEAVNYDTIVSLTNRMPLLSVSLGEAIADFTAKGSDLSVSLLERNKDRMVLLAVGSLILLALFIYFSSHVIAGPLERLSAASTAAEMPGGEFILPSDPFLFKENQILAEAIASLVAARNSQQQKLEAKVSRRDAELAHLIGMDQLGSVAGNVAHDFSNFLTIVIGYAEMSLKKDLSDDLRKNIEQILNAASGGKGVTDQLLKISRRSLSDLVAVPVFLPEVVAAMEPLWKPFLGPTIEMEMELQDDLGNVLIEEQALTQIVMNLVTNARDAMPDGGKIKISVLNGSQFHKIDMPAHLDASLKYVVIDVSDQGVGIPDSMRKKMYQPYESTKGKGKGTGFGLSIVHNMVHGAGGGITYITELGRGTSFQVWLPELESPVSTPTHGARLLLIEDEAELRELAVLALEAEGHEVTSAASGVVAIKKHESDLSSFDAVISDIRMPGMDGDEVIKRFRKRHRTLPVLFISAHSFREIEENFESTCPTLFLEKPFSTEELNLRVHELLNLKNR